MWGDFVNLGFPEGEGKRRALLSVDNHALTSLELAHTQN
jgi:hypothetical protein